jgi:hypothetical protein
LGWLEGLEADAPVEVAAETDGGGDDIRLTFTNGKVAEAQVKRGLQASDELWSSLSDLVVALNNNEITYGLLVVCPNSSRTISRDLASDLVRLGEGNERRIRPKSAEFVGRLRAMGIDPAVVCAKLRIVTIAASQGSSADVRASRAELSHVCAEPGDAVRAWDRLYRDAHLMIECRGVRSLVAIAQVLRSAGVPLRSDPAGPPAALLEGLCRWTASVNESFTILGVPKPLPIDTTWIPVTPFARATDEQETTDGLMGALERYHAWDQRPRNRDEGSCDPGGLGRFYRRVVVVAGPGMGKSTLLVKLARVYARSGLPVLKVSAPLVARRMITAGSSFLEAVLTLALDGTDISVTAASNAGFRDWVLLVDGLDECGQDQSLVISGMERFVEGFPNARVIAVTRPVGYRASQLASWRHYDLRSFGENEISNHMVSLLKNILPDADPRQPQLESLAEEAMERSSAGRAAARSPLMLSLSAALFARGGALGGTRLAFYRAIFRLVENEPPVRAGPPPASSAVLARFLDVLGWTLVGSPNISLRAALTSCARDLEIEMALPALQARDRAEACLRYWEALGLLERLHHTNDVAVTFVHKTFAEFAAGRYLAAQCRADQARILREIGELEPWHEVIAFGSALGAGPVFLDELIRRGFEGPQGHARLLQGLEILEEAEPQLDDGRLVAIIDATVAQAERDRRSWALEVGRPLSAVARRSAELVFARAQPLLTHAQLWTRLVGWAACVEAKSDAFELDTLLSALEYFVGDERSDRMNGPGRQWWFNGGGKELLQDFAFHVAEIILARCDTAKADEILHDRFRAPGLSTMGFIMRLQRLLAPRGLRFRWDEKLRSSAKGSFFDLDPDTLQQHRLAIAGLLANLCDLEDNDNLPTNSEDRPLYILSGFLELIGLMRSAISEIWGFRDIGNDAGVREVWRAVARLGGLPLDELAREAGELRRSIADGEEAALTTLFHRVCSVDIPEPRWEAAEPLAFDLANVEAALRRPSMLIIEPALRLALAVGLPTDWRQMAERLLAAGEEETLWAAAELASKLPLSEALEVLFARSVVPPKAGSRYVFKKLAELSPPNDARQLAALRMGLLGGGPYTAVAAAEWAAASPPDDVEALLQESFCYWLRTEKPYPRNGIVPPSPRAALLKAQCRVAPPTIGTLVGHLKDRRSDVREVASNELIALIGAAPVDRAAFVEAVVAGTVPASLLESALKADVGFSSDEVNALLTMLQGEDSNRRFVALPLLRSPHIAPSRRRNLLAALVRDPDPRIHEAAAAMIEVEGTFGSVR